MTTEQAVEWILTAARTARSGVVVTPNIHHLRLAEIDPVFRSVVARAELTVADGWPLLAANRLLGGPRLPERVAGVDLVDQVLRTPDRLRVAVLGGAPGAAKALAGRIQSSHDVVVCDALTPGTWERESDQVRLAGLLAEREANLVLIALGAPKQEFLADKLRPFVHGPIICCGAAVEILAGVRPRAPRPVQSLGFEWAFRALLEPRRLLPRYVASGWSFVRTVGSELWRAKRQGTAERRQ